jgi:hypothetical protein
MKKIIYTRPDGGLSVVHPVESLPEVIARLPKDATNVQVIEDSELPKDRTFRNAWKSTNGFIEHDMEKCREIHREKLRRLRKPKLEAADVEFIRALEQGLPTPEIAARKQALRDVTADPAIESATSPEELKSVIPAVLK